MVLRAASSCLCYVVTDFHVSTDTSLQKIQHRSNIKLALLL